MSLLRPNNIALFRSGLGTLSCQVATGHRLAAVRAVRWQSSSSSSACKNSRTCVNKRCLLTSANDTTGTLTKQLAQTNALLEPVVEREKLNSSEQSNSVTSAQVVGGKGSEGNHFKQTESVIPVHDLQNPTHTGPWTISHPVYTQEELDAVKVVRRESVTLSDKIAAALVKIARTSYDAVTGYSFRHKPIPNDGRARTLQELRDGNHVMTPDQWLSRCLFLESIAGVPGMVAGMLRHLRSLRLMRRDGGWINTLMAEAENERMHLLTFMTIKQPSIFFRALILGAQGVFFNLFFLAYLVNPKAAHRFVGYLEEEACLTYTLCLEEMDKGRLPEWKNMPAPTIAMDYWRLPKGSTMQDVVASIRADESNHRFINHSYASLDQQRDFSPFALKEPSAILKGTKPGFTRDEAAEFVREARREAS